MNDFDYDIMTKKRIARGAAARKRGSNSRRCTLPSDYLTDAQKKARNGKMSIYNLSRPMNYETFKQMPRDLQREYLLKLRNDMHASCRVIALMFGCSDEVVRCALHDLGISTDGKRMVMSRDQIKRWNNWLAGDTEDTPTAADEPEAGSETETESTTLTNKARLAYPTGGSAELTEAPHIAALTGGKLNLRGTASEILRRLEAIFDAEFDAQMSVSVKFTVGNGAES